MHGDAVAGGIGKTHIFDDLSHRTSLPSSAMGWPAKSAGAGRSAPIAMDTNARIKARRCANAQVRRVMGFSLTGLDRMSIARRKPGVEKLCCPDFPCLAWGQMLYSRPSSPCFGMRLSMTRYRFSSTIFRTYIDYVSSACRCESTEICERCRIRLSVSGSNILSLQGGGVSRASRVFTKAGS